jgi:hypothetical protein
MNYDSKYSKAQPDSGYKGDYSKYSKAQPDSGYKSDYSKYSKAQPDSGYKGDYSKYSKAQPDSNESNKTKFLQDYEIRCVYKINTSDYYRNVHIYNYKKRIII